MRRRTGTWTLGTLVAAGVVAGIVALAGPAAAACHAFSVEVDPATVREGGTVTVTVRRDAAVAPSQVDVSTVDEDATAGQDYEPLERTVSFTGETEQTLRISTTDDDVDEGVEAFLVRLGNPGGCAVNPNFVLGPDARVRIRSADAAPSPEPTDEPSPTPQPPPSPSPTERAAAESAGDGVPAAVLVAAVAAALAVVALGVWLLRRRAT